MDSINTSTSFQVDKRLQKVIWRAKVCLILSIMLGKYVHNALATNDNLFRRECHQNPSYPFCSATKTTKHMLIECAWTKLVWYELLGIKCSTIPTAR